MGCGKVRQDPSSPSHRDLCCLDRVCFSATVALNIIVVAVLVSRQALIQFRDRCACIICLGCVVVIVSLTCVTSMAGMRHRHAYWLDA